MSIGRKFLTSAVAAGLTATAFSATAQESAPALNNGAVSFGLGADIVSKYIFRGFELEEDGLIVQPYVEASFAIAEGVDFYVGSWNSIHTEETGATSNSTEAWYESDFYAGVSLGLFDPISLDISYVAYLYPNNNFGDYQELNLSVGFDDSEMLGDYAVSPYALIAFEFATEDAFGDDDNIYLELGGEWGMSLVESEDYPIDLTIPVAIGLSIDEFYVDANGDNELFGFLSIGANLGVPLTFIPSEFGSWSAGAGVTVFFLNDEAGLDDGDNDDFNIVGSLGIAMEY